MIPLRVVVLSPLEAQRLGVEGYRLRPQSGGGPHQQGTD